MRTYTKMALAALGAGIVLAGVLVGQGEARDRDGWSPHQARWGGGPGMMMGHARALFEQADTDKDGKLTRAELDAFAAGGLQRHDGNGNGELDLEEFQGLWAEMTRPAQVRAFQFVDADGDGRITAAEMQQPLDRLFERLDRDDDGSIAENELRRPGRSQRN